MPAPILSNNYSVQNIFLRNQFFVDKTYTNTTGSTVNLVAGQLMGTILATGLAAPCISTNSDGSEMPRGLCGDNYTVLNNASVVIRLCIKGDINQNAITLNGGDTLASVVRTVSTGGGTLGDLITANTELILIPSTELSGYDN